MAREIARSLVQYAIAGSVVVNRQGRIWIQTKGSAQTGVQNLVDIYLGWTGTTVTYTKMDASTAHTTALGSRISANTASCAEASRRRTPGWPSCTVPCGE